MRKILVLAIVVLGLNSLTAQSGIGDIRFGFQVSPAFSWMNTDKTTINSNGTNLGLKLGMIGEFFFRENYSFSTGIGFHFNAGGTLFYENTIDTINIWSEASIPGNEFGVPGGTSFKYSLQYVEIPLGLKLRTREFGYIRYFIEPQINLAFRTQARGNIENVAGVDAEERFNIQTGVNPINLAWGVSVGAEYNLSDNTALFGGIGFQSGFADVTKDRKTQIIDNGRSNQADSKGKIHAIILRLGIMF